MSGVKVRYLSYDIYDNISLCTNLFFIVFLFFCFFVFFAELDIPNEMSATIEPKPIAHPS